MPEIGRLLGGRYRLVDLLGEGGMATIYRAHDEQLGRDVAVKLLRPEYGRDRAFVDRFRQEAKAAASLNHPNVVNVFDFGTDEAGPFIVMELVEGGDLGALIREEAPLPPTAAAEIARQIAEGLAAAHARGIVHRDIKPSNVLLAPGGRVKVVDFGIARALSESQLTLPGTTLGSIHYFSPEQARGEAVTGSSDLYSLGLVLFEMLTGQRAWRGETPAAAAMARLSGEPPVPSRLRPGIPPALDAIVQRALAPDPEHRFPSAAAFSQALGRFLQAPEAPAPRPAVAPMSDSAPTVVGVPAARTPVPAAAAPAMPARGTAYTSRRAVVETDEEEERRGAGAWGWAAALLALLLLVAAAVLIFLFMSRGSGGTAASPTPAVVQAPSLINLPLDQAQTRAERSGLRVRVERREERADRAPNTVLAQRPPPGAQIQEGAVINVTISTAPQTVAVPNLRGRTEAQAVLELSRAQLEPGRRTEDYSADVARGEVISTDPPAGREVRRGTRVDYVLSLGPEPTPTPTRRPTPTPSPTPTPAPVLVGNYCQLDLARARQLIEGDGLTIGQITPPGSPENWTVVDQAPLPGERVRQGAGVNLRVMDPSVAPGGPCLSATPSPR